MKRQNYFGILLIIIVLLTQNLFSQDSLRIEINNKKIIFKKLTFEAVRENRIKVSITDKFGEEIPGLTKNDFSIFRKTKKAEILKVSPLSESVDQKVKLVILLDNSASMAPYIDDLTSILDDLVYNLSSTFYISIVMFDEILDDAADRSKLHIIKSPFSKKIADVKNYYNYGLRSLTSRTYLFDGIKTGIEAIRGDTIKNVTKNFVVLLTDGNDIGSRSDLAEIQNIDKSKIVFYTVDFMHSSRDSRSRNIFLKNIANESGGEYFSPNNINSLRTNFKKITTGIINLGYEIDYEFKHIKPSIIFKLNTPEFSQRPLTYRSFQGVLIEDMKMKESFPLLNYVFFEKHSDRFPSRYKQLSDSNNIKSFSENKIDGNAIEHYYHILNIYGKRLKDISASNITLIGNTDGSEENWEELSLNRANRVKKYFTDIWKIDPSRIQVLTGKLPGKPSINNIEEGKAENRRVEFYSNNWEIIKPVTFLQDTMNVTPKLLDFKISAGNPAAIKKITLDISHNNVIWNTLQFNNQPGTVFQYDWRNKEDLLPRGISKLDFRVRALDYAGDSIFSNLFSLPVKELTPEIIRIEKLQEKNLQKVSLILFDFDSFNPGEKNETIMKEYVYRKLSDTSQYITVNGYTDKIGKPDYNLRLSSKRAEKISNLLITKYPPKKIKFKGLGSGKPIYTNSLPEGRFYNRTVQLIFQNYKP